VSRDGANGGAEQGADHHILLIGEGSLADATQRALHAASASVTRLHEPDDGHIREALEEELDTVVIVSKDDHLSLRLALVVENVRPGIALVATVHGRIVAEQLERVVENARVVSRADVVAPVLAAACFQKGLLLVRPDEDGFSGVRSGDDLELRPVKPSRQRLDERLLANLGSLIRPYEVSARILMAGLFGFLVVLIADAVGTALVLHESPIDAFYAVTKAIVTVGPNPKVESGPAWFKIFSAVAMIAALALTAIFTAGVVDRLLDRRLSAIMGPRAVPRKDHVVVVGMGNVGLRLCQLLQRLGVRVLAIEGDESNYNVERAKDNGIPVIIGRGGSHFLLRRLALPRARALAAVTSDEVENIAIVGAALGVRDDLRTLLRAGRGEVTNETRSLFKLGVVRDVNRIGGTFLAMAALGRDVRHAFLDDETVYLIMSDDTIERVEDREVEAEEKEASREEHAGARAGDE
jgi:Trk K+ transport system NAD-binding subunit